MCASPPPDPVATRFRVIARSCAPSPRRGTVLGTTHKGVVFEPLATLELASVSRDGLGHLGVPSPCHSTGMGPRHRGKPSPIGTWSSFGFSDDVLTFLEHQARSIRQL